MDGFAVKYLIQVLTQHEALKTLQKELKNTEKSFDETQDKYQKNKGGLFIPEDVAAMKLRLNRNLSMAKEHNKAIENENLEAEKRMQDKLQKLRFEFDKRQVLSKRMTELGLMAAPLSLGAGALIKGGIATRAEREQQEIQFKTNFGELSNEALEFARILDAKLPAGFDQVAQLMTTMQNTGRFAFGDLKKFTEDLSSVIFGMGAGKGFDGIANQMKQIISKGFAQTMDLRIIEEWGLPITKLLRESLGKTSAEVQDMISKGLITAEMIQKVLGENAPKYASQIANYSKTMSGSVDVMKSSFANLKEQIGATFQVDNMFSNTMNALSDVFQGMANTIKEMSPEGKKLLAIGLALTTIAAPVLLIGSRLVMWGSAIGKVGGQIAQMTGGITGINASIGTMALRFGGIFSIITLLVGVFRDIFQEIGLINKEMGSMEMLGKGLSITFKVLAKTLEAISIVLSNAFSMIADAVGAVIKLMMTVTTFSGFMGQGNTWENTKNAIGATKENQYNSYFDYLIGNKTQPNKVEKAIAEKNEQKAPIVNNNINVKVDKDRKTSVNIASESGVVNYNTLSGAFTRLESGMNTSKNYMG